MTDTVTEPPPFHEIRSLVKGLFEPNPIIYWTDFLFSVSLG